jgi:hypothetical protein
VAVVVVVVFAVHAVWHTPVPDAIIVHVGDERVGHHRRTPLRKDGHIQKHAKRN